MATAQSSAGADSGRPPIRNPTRASTSPFSRNLGGTSRREVDLARSGHNHWTLERIIDAINRHANSTNELSEWMVKTAAAYAQSTNSDRFAQAVQMAYLIVSG